MDFSGRSEKLEKEAKLRREALKQKKEKENALEAKAALRDEAAAELRLIKRETEEKLAEERDELLVADRLLTGGITFLEDHLAPYLIEGEDDKIILPESCLIELNQLDVFVGKGPVLLRLRRSCLSSETEEYTHCGIREFSAKPGTIGIPSKILHSILSRDKGNHPYTSTVDGDAGAQKAELDKRVLQLGGLSAKYVKAPKCTFAQLQPVHNSFSQVGPVKMVLEENLRRHVTLSIGDILQVWYRGTCHELRVNVMQPGPFGSLVDTDVEVDLDTSLEYNQSQSQQQQSKQQQAAPVVRTVASGHAAASAVVESAGVFRTLAGQGSLSGHNSSQANVPKAGEKREKRELPPEPAEGEPAIKCRLKHPTGITITRSLRPEDPMWVLFELAANELQLASANPITLTTRFPARCLAYEESKDLSASELDLNWQEMFMVSVDS